MKTAEIEKLIQIQSDSWVKNKTHVVYECFIGGIYHSATATTLEKCKEKIIKKLNQEKN